MSELQSTSQGRDPDQVLPRVLHGLSEDALRDASAKVSQVQRRVRRQRLPPYLHRLDLGSTVIQRVVITVIL
jgi:hypothetical protein